MFWSGARLEKNITNIFDPADPKSVDCNSYTLHVGNEVHISADGNADAVTRRLDPGEQFVIPPGQFAFLLTQEVITIPFQVMAFINVKSSIKLAGLVNVSGFHVDPGYRGRLVISVFNAGPKPVILAEGDPCFLIWLCDLTEDADFAHSKKFAPGFMSITSKLVQQVPSNNLSLHTISKEMKDMKAKIDLVFAIVLGVGIPFFVALLVAIMQVVFSDWMNGKAVAITLNGSSLLAYFLVAFPIFIFFSLAYYFKFLKQTHTFVIKYKDRPKQKYYEDR